MKKLVVIVMCTLLLSSFLAFVGCRKKAEPAKEGKLFDGVTVSVVAHSGHHATPWYNEAPVLKEKYGLELNVIEITADEIYSRVVLELTQRTGAYDIVQYNSAWIGDYEAYILPLDDYVAQDNDEIGFADLLPAFNKAQNLWGGKKVSITIDGDTFLFYYRKDLFEDAVEKAAFKARYGYELPDPPDTWEQVVDLAQFFTRKKGEKLAGRTLTKDFYGYADQAKRGRVYYWYLFRYVPFSAPDPHYFDPGSLEPKINSSGAVAALDNMKELLKYSPPGVLSWEWDELFAAAMKDGTVGMWIHWTDEGPGPVNLGYIMDADIGWDPSRYSHFNSKEWRAKVPGIEKYLELELKALELGYPMLKIPGAFEYNDVLDLNVSKYLAGEFPSAQAALDAVAKRWNELNEKFGVDKQKGFYAKVWQ